MGEDSAPHSGSDRCAKQRRRLRTRSGGRPALREARLVDQLRARGLSVNDLGNVRPWRWRPDHDNRRAMNGAAVAETATAVAAKVSEALGRGHVPLVLGGDCTVELGTMMGARRHLDGVRLLYFDAIPT